MLLLRSERAQEEERGKREKRDTNPSDFERASDRTADAICIYSRIPDGRDKLIKSLDAQRNEQDEKRSQIRHKSAEAREREMIRVTRMMRVAWQIYIRISRRQMTLFHAIHGGMRDVL